MKAPTKSGVIGLICCAMGKTRLQSEAELKNLVELQMGVRIDRAGVRWWDYHTIGARYGMLTAEREIKETASTHELETLVSRREYLCDASFLVALRSDDTGLIDKIRSTLGNPKWTFYLGRKCCPPSRPLLEHPAGDFPDLLSALQSVPWRKRMRDDPIPETVECLLDWQPTPEQPEAPIDALVWHDVPLTFDPPAHAPRFVIRQRLSVGPEVSIAEKPAQGETPRPLRPRADYKNTEYQKARDARLKADYGLCVFCKAPANTVQHITYRRAGGGETNDDLRSLCRLCHDAVTMIEYGLGMGLDRINPEDPEWREEIIRKRQEIIRFRSLATRRRSLNPEEVE